MLTLHTNVSQMSSLNTQRATGSKLNEIMRDLSTGKKNDLYKNDPAAARISAMLNMHASGTKSAISNMKYAQSSTRVAQGALDKVNELLVTMKDLATQAKDGLKGEAEKSALQQQYTNNAQALKAIFDNTTFAGKNLLKMTFGGDATGILAKDKIDLQVGADKNETKELNISAELQALFASIGDATGKFGTQQVKAFDGTLKAYEVMGASNASAGADAVISALKANPEMARILASEHTAAGSNPAKSWEDMLKTSLETELDKAPNDAAAFSTALQTAMGALIGGGNAANTPLNDRSALVVEVNKALQSKLTAQSQLGDAAGAGSAIQNLESAISQLATVQASIGAAMMDLDGREEVQSTLLQNTSEANSRLNEVDFAESVSELTKLQTQMNVNLQMLQKAGEMPGMIQMLLR
ncbi:flagellin [Pandoraea pnomenusa]|uniref:flagellin n=1 Tax=Pandoraea pnomenusa TaxID=93220 RepID=UPI0033423DA8